MCAHIYKEERVMTYPSSESIKQRPPNRTAGKLHKSSERSNPGDGVWRVVLELMAAVVCLEDAKGVGEAEAGEEDAGASGYDEPGLEATVGGIVKDLVLGLFVGS